MAERREDRWDRLAADLAAAGVPDPRVDRLPYSETRYGRVVHGVTSSITILVPGWGTVDVRDKWNRADKWLGWEVCAADAAGIDRGPAAKWTMNRGEAVRAVLARMPAGSVTPPEEAPKCST